MSKVSTLSGELKCSGKLSVILKRPRKARIKCLIGALTTKLSLLFVELRATRKANKFVS